MSEEELELKIDSRLIETWLHQVSINLDSMCHCLDGCAGDFNTHSSTFNRTCAGKNLPLLTNARCSDLFLAFLGK